ncbi:MFS transporter [Streptomyces sp. HB2AG]|uniref:MFS transporter n=1 Tax=Streptomyces sp. HB2AG TaxID=2983400 RepID=UPI0022AAB230|nr:MFS transporter [Streptomyces sp. HB2AG]MCZ2527098.1 MFS transporter [Streptomyces sp. HB2AG]
MSRRGRTERAGRARTLYLGTLFLPLALQNFLLTYNSTAMNVALSAILDDLGTTLTGVQAAISLYSLVVAAFLITGSKLGARHGHRRVFVLGAEVFVLGTLLTAFGPSLAYMLVGWSLVQGIGVALMLPALLSLITREFTGADRTRALSALGTVGGIGAAVGPLLGGVFTHYVSWRASFLMGTVITTVVVLALRRTPGPGPDRAGPREPFDAAGSVLSAAGVGLLVVATLLAGRYGLVRARQDFEVFGHVLFHRGGPSPVPFLAGAGLVVLAVFAVRERRLVRSGRDPLVRLSVLRNRTVRTGSETQAMQYLVPNGIVFLVPVFLQTTLGFDALWCGITLVATTLGLMTAAPVAAGLVGGGRVTHRAAQTGSFLLMAAGCVVIAATFDPQVRDETTTGLAFAPGLFLLGLGQGLATTVTDLIQSAPSPDEVDDVTGLSRSGTYLGSSLGVALAGAFMAVALLHSFEAGANGSTVLTPAQKQLVTRTVEEQVQLTAASDEEIRAELGSRGVTGAAAGELVRINARAREQALAWAGGSMAVLALCGCLVAGRIPRTRTPDPPPPE